MLSGFTPPTHLSLGEWGDARLERGNHSALLLFVNDRQVMTYSPESNQEAWELKTQVDMAQGHVICTGLGLGIREQWLLTKPEVTRLTVLECSEGVIAMHREHSEWLNDPRVEIIHCDASAYTGSCDWLLLDHFLDLLSLDEYRAAIVADPIAQNIDHQAGWAWPLEWILAWGNTRVEDAYSAIKQEVALKLPILSDQELRNIVAVGGLKPIELLP